MGDGAMNPFTVFLLSGDQDLYDLVRGLLANCDVVMASCLRGYSWHLSILWLIIDPRCVRECCLDCLMAWRMKMDPRQVVFLPFAAPPDILLTLPRIIHGLVAAPEQLPALIETRLPRRRAEAAWTSRGVIFNATYHSQDVESFLKLALD